MISLFSRRFLEYSGEVRQAHVMIQGDAWLARVPAVRLTDAAALSRSHPPATQRIDARVLIPFFPRVQKKEKAVITIALFYFVFNIL